MKCDQCGRHSIGSCGLVQPDASAQNKLFCSWECLGAYKRQHLPPSTLSQLVAVLDRLHLLERLVVLDGDHSAKPAFCTVCNRSFPSQQEDYADTSWHDPACAVLELARLLSEARKNHGS